MHMSTSVCTTLVGDQPRASPATLLCKEAGSWVWLPRWGDFFFQLGALLARQANAEYRLVIGLAVPTRAFAASLVGAGLVTASAEMPNTMAQVEAHFAQIAALPLGTPLVYRRYGKQRLRAIFDGCADGPSTKYLRIKVEAGRSGNCYLLDARLAQYVQVADGKSPRLPKNQRGSPLAQASQFVAYAVGSNSAEEFVSVSRFDCLLVGSATKLRAELVDTPIAIKNAPLLLQEQQVPGRSDAIAAARRFAIGNLQSLLRARRFLASGEPYRSDVLPGHSHVPADQLTAVPRFVIFDGATSFLRCRDSWQHSHWVVVLDKAEREFCDATSAFDQDFVKFRTDSQRTLDVGCIPASVDVAVYEEAWP